MERGHNTLYMDYRGKVASGVRDYQRPGLWHYVLQSCIAAVFVSLTMLIAQYVTSVLALVAVASTAFVVFARPKSIEAAPRNVLGGHVLSVASAVPFCLIAPLLPLSETMQIVALGGPTVALAMFLMTITDTEHAPAAGAALAMVAHAGEFISIGLMVLASGVVISMSRTLCGRWLRDLT